MGQHSTIKRKKLLEGNHRAARKPFIVSIMVGLFLLFFFLANYLCVSAENIILLFQGSESTDIFSVANALTFSLPFPFYIFLALISLGIALHAGYLISVNFKDYNVGQRGVQRWATLEEIRTQYKAVPEKDVLFNGSGGVPVCREKNKIYVDDTLVNNLIIGITRSGKGEMFIFPMIDLFSRAKKDEDKPSLIITDPKLELAAASMETLEKRGYEVHLLNLINPYQSMGYNPLTAATKAYREGDMPTAELLIRSFCYKIYPVEGKDDPFWSENSILLLTAMILALMEDSKTMEDDLNARFNLHFLRKKEKILGVGWRFTK